MAKRGSGRNRRGGSRPRARSTRGPSRVSRQLTELNIVERTQQRSLAPIVMDVPKIVMARERLMMFERTITGPIVSASNTVPTFGSFRITLDTLPNYSEFTTLFDAYRILQTTVTFFPTSSMSSGALNSILYTVIDYDDDNVPTSVAELAQYPSLQTSVPGAIVERTFNPVAAQPAYSGTFSSYARMSRRTFVDANSPGVIYYGLKWGLTTNSVAIQLYSVTLRVIVQCRNVR